MTILSKLALLTGWWFIGSIAKGKENQKVIADARIYADSVNKPILNLGCGSTDWGDINADIVQCSVKNFILIDANKPLPFEDAQFAVCFCSHLIEHLNNPEFSIKEMHRVADKVFLTFPEFWQLGTWLTPDHKWLVTKDVGSPYGVKLRQYTPIPAIGLTALWLLKGG